MRGAVSIKGLFPMGWLSALTLNACLLVLAIAGAHVYAMATRPDVYGYDATPSALASTRRAVEDIARAMPPEDDDRIGYWSRLVRAELDTGDLTAARGFLVAARAMLPAREAARLESKLPASPDNAAIAAAAVTFLEPDVRVRFEGAPLNPSGAAPLLIGAGADLDERLRELQAGRPTDPLDLGLQCLAAAMREDSDSAFVGGASVLLAARRSGALRPELAAHYQGLIDAALPVQTLRDAMSTRLSDSPVLAADNLTGLVLEAVRRDVDTAEYATLRAAMADLNDIAVAASPAGAVRLIGLAESPRDLERLRLLSLSSGELAVAVVKRAPVSEVMAAASGTWRLNARDWLALVSSALAAIGLVIATIVGVSQSVRQALQTRAAARGGSGAEEREER